VLADRREEFGTALPKEVLRLVAGVDVQNDRLEVHVIGVGHPEELWSVRYKIIPGDPARLDVWNQLDELLKEGCPSAWGINLTISAVCIDSGGNHTEMVYRFCRARTRRNIWAIKGSSWSRRGDPVWPVPKSRTTRDTGFKPFVIAVDSAKDHLRNILMQEEVGPGYFHIPMQRSDAWLAQLTAEQPVFEKKGGITTRRWHLPKGRANEAFDTTIYAYAALCGLKAHKGANYMEKVWAEMASAVAKWKGVPSNE
jgi:phage terminase large subunit GpA-like protein